MPKYPMAAHTYLAVADAGGVSRNLAPYLSEIEPLGRQTGAVEVTALNDTARHFQPGIELPQDFAIYGYFDDTPVSGPDVVLAGIVGKISAISYGPAGRQPGQRKISGQFLCRSYQVFGRIDGPVRFTARFRQTGPVELGFWD